MTRRTLVKPGDVVRVAVIAAFFLAAPVAGDIGSCGEAAQDLDPNKFFVDKQAIDCDACKTCGLTTATCKSACGPRMGGTFPTLCYPVVHDGEVCLDALLGASCTDYAHYVADEGASVPTECDFCPAFAAPDAGAP